MGSLKLNRFRVLVAVLFAFFTGLGTEHSHAANLSIKLFVLSEIEACRPSGYVSSCEGWKADEVQALFERAPVSSISNIPPGGTINLGGLLPAVRSYARFVCPLDDPCSDPRQRQVVMLLFEWDEPQTGTIVFERRPVGDLEGRITRGQLHNELRWIDHQRADLFFPAYDTQWQLKLGDTWTLTAQ